MNQINPINFFQKQAGQLGAVGSPLTGGANHPAQKQDANIGLVERLDKMDAMYQKPNHQNEFQANKLDFFA